MEPQHAYIDFNPYRMVELITYRWICTMPSRDPLGLNDTLVIAPNAELALAYLLDAGGWRDQYQISTDLRENYCAVGESGAPAFHGSFFEWLQAVHAGMYPREVVRFPEGALTQEVIDARAPKVKVKPNANRKGFFARVEDFLERQWRYRLVWKSLGYLALVAAGALVIYFLWQALLGLLTTYIVVFAITSAIKNS